MVDGVHGLGADDEPVRIESLDVLVAGCHKWLGGPRGTGLVWSIKAWDRLKPTIPSFAPTSYAAWLDGHSAAARRPARPGLHARRLPPRSSTGGRWPRRSTSRPRSGARVAERIRSLATRLKQGLAEIPRVRLITPMAERLSAGIVCFDVVGSIPARRSSGWRASTGSPRA